MDYLKSLSMSGSVCLPQTPSFHLHNLVQGKINEDFSDRLSSSPASEMPAEGTEAKQTAASRTEK